MAHEDRFYVGPPTKFDKYMLVECLGAGGEGEVWTAQLTLSPQGRRRVAIKILRDDQIGRDDESWERYADLLRSVSHPGLVRVSDAFIGARMHRKGESPSGQRRYVVMDFVEGETLRDWLAECPDSTLTHRLRTLRNVAAALDEMHSGVQTAVPVAHGDVKPGNIVIRDDGSTVLVDLGLMRISDGTAVTGATAPYAAPELFRPGAFTSPAGDRFAFAATVAHMVLGGPPPVNGAGRGLDLEETGRLLEQRRLTANRPVLRDQVMQALTTTQDKRPANLSQWLSSLTENLPRHDDDQALEKATHPQL